MLIGQLGDISAVAREITIGQSNVSVWIPHGFAWDQYKKWFSFTPIRIFRPNNSISISHVYSGITHTSAATMLGRSQVFDVLILGAGPAGLSAATGLARQLYTSVVFNTNTFRNSRVQHMHNVLGWDHQDPAFYRAKAREDLDRRYAGIVTWADSVSLQELKKPEDLSQNHEVDVTDPDMVTESKSRTTFEAIDTDGSVWRGRKVILATGVRDLLPLIEGYDDCWGYGM